MAPAPAAETVAAPAPTAAPFSHAPASAVADAATVAAPAAPAASAVAEQDAPAAAAATATAADAEPSPVRWAMPAPAVERPAADDRWAQNGPKASADLWPTAERAEDPWTRLRTTEKGLGGEPSGEGYAAWDAAPSSWIGWNTPSEERVEEVVAYEVPEPPAAEAEPAGDQDETAPFAWPDEPGAEATVEAKVEVEAPGPDVAEAAEVLEAAEPIDDAEVLAEAVPDDGDELPAAETDDAARDGWDAYIASREVARAKAAEGDVVARGMSLVEQLRDLLPAIVLSEPATMRRVASDLTAARDEAQAMPREDLDELRGVIEASRDNPKDIDALVQLGKHAHALIELMGSYERYSGAIDRAVGELSQGQGQAPGAISGTDVADELPAETDAIDERP